MDKESIIYLVPGLGVDHRIFLNFRLKNIPQKVLHWIKPLNPEESLSSYVSRLAERIDLEYEKIYILGVSFGGIVAQEISKIIECKKVFVVSSIKTHHEAPATFTLFKSLSIASWLPTSLLKKSAPLVSLIFGAKRKEEKETLNGMLKHINPHIVKWSLKAIVEWRNELVPENLVHIHGTDDLVFPVDKIKDFIPIKKGTHIMIGNRAEEIEEIVLKNL